MTQGRKTIPTALLKLTKGKLYSDQRDRAELEPKPKRELRPKCPGRLSKDEKKEWRYFKRVLENYNLFTIANGPIVEMIAKNMVQYKDCAEKVSETGMMVRGKSGELKYNPYWSAMNLIEAKIIKGLQELGLSSSGLARIGSLALKAKKQKSDLEGMMD